MIFVEELLLTHVDCDGEADVDVEASVIRSRIFFIVSKTKWILYPWAQANVGDIFIQMDQVLNHYIT